MSKETQQGSPLLPEHSFLCQIYHCYAFEIGCCEPHFYEGDDGELRKPDRCICISEAFDGPPAWEEDIGHDCSEKRFRPWVDRYGNRPVFWDRKRGNYVSVPATDRMRGCVVLGALPSWHIRATVPIPVRCRR